MTTQTTEIEDLEDLKHLKTTTTETLSSLISECNERLFKLYCDQKTTYQVDYYEKDLDKIKTIDYSNDYISSITTTPTIKYVYNPKTFSIDIEPDKVQDELLDEDWGLMMSSSPKKYTKKFIEYRAKLIEVLTGKMPKNITFIKESTKTARNMICTLNNEYIPMTKQNLRNNFPKPDANGVQKLDILHVFDLELQDWRSFKINNLRSISDPTTEQLDTLWKLPEVKGSYKNTNNPFLFAGLH